MPISRKIWTIAFTAILLSSLCGLTGCAKKHFPDPVATTETTVQAQQAVHSFWAAGMHSIRLRFTGKMNDGNQETVFHGLIKGNPAAGSLRAIVFSPLGAKLFDSAIEGELEHVYATLPGTGVSVLRTRFGAFLRQTILQYKPQATDVVSQDGDVVTLARCADDICLRSFWNRATTVRTASEYRRENALIWSASYKDHIAVGSYMVPKILTLNALTPTHSPWSISLVLVSVDGE